MSVIKNLVSLATVLGPKLSSLHCKHSYVRIGQTDIESKYHNIIYYVCRKCGKREVFYDKTTKQKTQPWFIDLTKKWERGEYELTPDDVTGELLSPTAIHLENCWNK